MKYIKKYKIFESFDPLKWKYGKLVIDECNLIIEDIKDMLLELKDMGLYVTVGYTPMTLVNREETPKIMASVSSVVDLYNQHEEDINLAFERIKEYVKEKGYSTDFGYWEWCSFTDKHMKESQILIQR
jgi:hypothetical protein